MAFASWILSALLFVTLVATMATALPRACGVLDPQPAPILSNEGLQLLQVNAVFRHGDRTNYQDLPCWPGDTALYQCGLTQASTASMTRQQATLQAGRLLRLNYMEGRNYYAGNCQTGQLTDRGWLQMRGLGSMYRSLYADQYGLMTEMDSSTMYFRTDSKGRNVASMDGLFAGLFPANETLSTDGSWVAWNVDTMDDAYDDISPNTRLCPVFKTYTQNFTSTTAYQQHVEEYSDRLYAQMSAALGTPINGVPGLDQSHDCMIVHACHHQEMPEGVTRQLFDAVVAEYSYVAWSMYNYPSVQANTQAGIGFLLTELLEYMDTRVAGNSTIALTFWSGHDTTIAPLLNALGMWDGAWIPYAAHVEMEIWEDTTGTSPMHYLRVLYNGHVVSTACGQDGLCDYTQFRADMEPLLPVEGTCT